MRVHSTLALKSCGGSQLKPLDMNVIVLGKHTRLPSFIKLKPSGLWELENTTNYFHYVILTMYICNFLLLFYSSIFSVYSSCFSQINLMKAGIGQSKYHLPWPFSHCLISLCRSLFDVDFMKEIFIVNSERANGKRKCCCKKIR